jgi:hypothetical protein
LPSIVGVTGDATSIAATIQQEFSPGSAVFQVAPVLCSACSSLSGSGEVAAKSNGECVVNSPMKPTARVAQVRAHRWARVFWTILGQAGLATALIVATGLACAQSPNGAIKEFGLLGTWADHCNMQPAPSNQHATFSVTSRGTVLLRNDFGPVYGDMVYRIIEARRISEFRLSLRQVLTTDENVVIDTVMLSANAKVRVWSSRGIDGRQYVDYGLVPTANNRETDWMERCDMRWANPQ